jgi:biotin transport system substrate-specific component
MSRTYADLLRPATSPYTWLYDLTLIVGGSFVIGLMAQIAIPLPFTPVPITGSTLAVLMAGALLGSRRGSLCILTYLAEGLAGLPVFAGGNAGMTALLGPTGGYLVGFVLAAFVTGWLAEREWDRHLGKNFLAMLAGNVVLYLPGVLWLSVYTDSHLAQALTLGLYPFIVGDLIKLAVATSILPLAWHVVRH